MNVLVAEDDATSRSILQALLKKWGYDPQIVCDGNRAWDALRCDDPPKLAILDWMMPGSDGVEVCRRLREERPHDSTYIIIVTARTHKIDIVQGLDAGANDYVCKPFDSEELHARIEVGRRVVELQSALNDRVRELQDALEHVKMLQGILPICSYCKKIRDDQNYWQQVEGYIEKHSKAEFSHSICPACFEKHVKPMLEEDCIEDDRFGVEVQDGLRDHKV